MSCIMPRRRGSQVKNVELLLGTFSWLPVLETDVAWARSRYQGKDFEDALQIACALREGCTKFVTLDQKLATKFSGPLSIDLFVNPLVRAFFECGRRILWDGSGRNQRTCQPRCSAAMRLVRLSSTSRILCGLGMGTLGRDLVNLHSGLMARATKNIDDYIIRHVRHELLGVRAWPQRNRDGPW